MSRFCVMEVKSMIRIRQHISVNLPSAEKSLFGDFPPATTNSSTPSSPLETRGGDRTPLARPVKSNGYVVIGILFRDVTTLLLDHKAFKDTIDIFVERYKDKKIDVIVGIEARGFIFGPPIALAIGAKFVPQRKPRKLPGEVVRQEYSLEYGTDCIEMHVGAVQPGDRCVIVDDLIATGGTLAAGIKLVERVGAEVVECACLVELSDLKGRQKLSGAPLFILVDFEGE